MVVKKMHFKPFIWILCAVLSVFFAASPVAPLPARSAHASVTFDFMIPSPQVIGCIYGSFGSGQCRCCEREVRRRIPRVSDDEFFDEPNGTVPVVNDRITSELTAQREFIINLFWEDNVLPALMMMSDQMSAVSLYQTQIIGQFFDAKHQLETQRSFDMVRARAHKDYHPSTGMCEFGSSTRSLVASERKSEYMMHVMSQRFQDRMLGNTNTSGARGPAADYRARLRQYREQFCDPADYNGALGYLCEHDQDNNLDNSTPGAEAPGGMGAENPERANKDIDFIRTVEFPWTLDIDFTDETLTDQEEEVIALGDNLYATDVFARIPGTLLEQEGVAGDALEFSGGYGLIMDARAALAKLSVAYNSYNAITSMKAAGTGGSRDFLEGILADLGISETAAGDAIDEMRRTLGYSTESGEEIGPSYYAQMEVLTRKIYQNPDFYTNLYDKPANVERKKVAMQAIGLMQKFDLFKSYLRNEATLSVLLEVAVEDLQANLETQIQNQGEEGIN